MCILHEFQPLTGAWNKNKNIVLPVDSPHACLFMYSWSFYQQYDKNSELKRIFLGLQRAVWHMSRSGRVKFASLQPKEHNIGLTMKSVYSSNCGAVLHCASTAAPTDATFTDLSNCKAFHVDRRRGVGSSWARQTSNVPTYGSQESLPGNRASTTLHHVISELPAVPIQCVTTFHDKVCTVFVTILCYHS